ncbi:MULTISPECIES: hypothetical protein [Rhodovulum]|uniref:hypothetical protein n=1 Tax=Rhodovulum TaxID=34008 RepID=UPI0011B1FFC7|nr:MULTISPECIES: hypothetical protein [Rhodovulum]
MITLEIRGTGSSCAVYMGNERVSRFFLKREAAICAERAIAQRLQQRQRSCLCCGAEFTSHGAGNRLCNTCRQEG